MWRSHADAAIDRSWISHDLERECPRLPALGNPEETYTLGRCLKVIMREECEHRRFAIRDLAVLETDLDDPPAV